MQRIRELLKCDDGATAVEYGLIVGTVSVAIVVGAIALGTEINQAFVAISVCVDLLTTTACQ